MKISLLKRYCSTSMQTLNRKDFCFARIRNIYIKSLQRLGCRSVRLIAAERSVPYLDAIFSHPVEALWTQLGAGCTLMTYTGVNSSSTSTNSHLETSEISYIFRDFSLFLHHNLKEAGCCHILNKVQLREKSLHFRTLFLICVGRKRAPQRLLM